MPDPDPDPVPGPQSVDRALDILDAVADATGPVTAKALARRLGCSLSTVYHLLGPLIARNHLVRTAGGYAPGPRALALHRSFQRYLRVGPGIGELLLRVRRAAGAHAYFTAYRDGAITVLDSTSAPAPEDPDPGNPGSPGHPRDPGGPGGPHDPFTLGPEARAHATAHGKVLLAQLPRAARHRYLYTHGMARLTKRTITGAGPLEAELARVREAGVAVSVGEASPDYACLAVPLPGDRTGGVAHALSVSLPSSDFPRRHGELRAVLRQFAARP